MSFTYQPEIVFEPPSEHGPVLITVEYQVSPRDSAKFRKAAEALKALRHQHGAKEWGLFVDIENPTLFKEVFLKESWGIHLKNLKELSAEESKIIESVSAFHSGEDKPFITCFAYCSERFPTGKESPLAKEYPVTASGVPLWFSESGPAGENEG